MTIDIDKKTFAIGILSLTAVAMFISNLSTPPTVRAAEVVKDRDYQMITARTAQGDDGLYVIENRTGLMAIFLYSVKARRLEPMAVQPVMEAFAGGPAPLVPKGR